MMVPEVVVQRRLTLADYEAMPDDKDYEIIDGVLYMSPRARPGHQMTASNFVFVLMAHAADRRLGRVIPDADLIIDDRNTYISPDIMFSRSERVPLLNPASWLRIIPDLIVEVISPSTEDYDRFTKSKTYERLGVPHYWIADPHTRQITENVLRPSGQYSQRVAGPGGTFHPSLFPDLQIDLEWIFT